MIEAAPVRTRWESGRVEVPGTSFALPGEAEEGSWRQLDADGAAIIGL